MQRVFEKATIACGGERQFSKLSKGWSHVHEVPAADQWDKPALQEEQDTVSLMACCARVHVVLANRARTVADGVRMSASPDPTDWPDPASHAW
eukprot:4666448-Alexandrium_andersonii.AAC.1